MFERFTDPARRVVVLAQEEARLLEHNYIGTEHLLLGLVRENDGLAAQVLADLNVSLERARESVERRIGTGGGAPVGHIAFTPRAKVALELSLREALQLGHNYIGTEHILLGLLAEGEGVAVLTLAELGLEPPVVRAAVLDRAAGTGVAPAPSGTGRTREDPPNCPGCWRSLEGRAASRVITVGGDGEHDERRVRVVYCGACGQILGLLPE